MWDALRHVAFGSMLMVAGWLISLAWGLPGNFGAAWALAAGFYLGRERRDHEIRAKIPIRDWWKGWGVWTWDIKEREDLVGPVLTLAVLAYLASLVFPV